MDKDMRGRVLEQLKRAKLISRKEKMDLLYDLKEVKAIEKEVAGKHVAELKRILSSVNTPKWAWDTPAFQRMYLASTYCDWLRSSRMSLLS